MEEEPTLREIENVILDGKDVVKVGRGNKDVYVLSLASEKYYVGITEDLGRENKNRLQYHEKDAGADWTIKYSPISLHQAFLDCDREFEDIVTVVYSRLYGQSDVRGGTWHHEPPPY